MGEMVTDNHLSVYAGKRVLVTGHTGFKGPWLCLALKELGADILGYALAPEDDSHFRLLGLESHIRHVEGDIRDYGALMRIVAEYEPEFVFHLAAQALVRSSYLEPQKTFETNVVGSVNVLEAVRHCPSVRALVYITSDKCYLNRERKRGYRENDRLGGHDPYSASKAAAELVFSSYVSSFFGSRPEFGAASARAGNVIGGGDWAKDRIVPDCLRALLENNPIRLRNPRATRPWQHVMESLSGYLLLGARLFMEPRTYSGAWNFGPDEQDIRTVEDLANNIIRGWGGGTLAYDGFDPEQHEAHTLHLNSQKAHRLLGWRPCWDFDRAVSETVYWYREVMSGAAAYAVTRDQIRQYLREAVYE